MSRLAKMILWRVWLHQHYVGLHGTFAVTGLFITYTWWHNIDYTDLWVVYVGLHGICVLVSFVDQFNKAWFMPVFIVLINRLYVQYKQHF